MIVAPSILSADFKCLERDIRMLNESDAQWVHCDVMDGVFVPNISFGFPVIRAVRELTDKVLDVHLMIVQPERYIGAARDAGADIMNIHQEACTHLHRTVTAIHEAGMRAGVTLNPSTPVSTLVDIIEDVDLVLLMSVNPGFGGQKFIPHTLKKLVELSELKKASGSKAIIEVDGGVSLANAAALKEAGAEALVAGNAVFKAENPREVIANLRRI